MNTYVIPSPLLKMGLEDDSDTFNFFIRPTFFEDQHAGDAYTKNPLLCPTIAVQLNDAFKTAETA
jgi:hypothetical protein